MDIISYILARKKAKAYTDEKVAEYVAGLSYQGEVNAYADLPTPSASIKGHCYNVKTTTTVQSVEHKLGLYVCNGTAWTAFTIAGVDGRGIVSITKTSTAGLVDTYTITYTDATTSTFTVTNGADGRGITSITINAEYKMVITFTDGTTWTSEVSIRGPQGPQGDPGDISDVYITGQSFKDGHGGANLQPMQDQINNLKNIGRFLSILNCSNGTVSSQPSGAVGSSYLYKVGDYYRVGGAGNYGPKGLDTFTIDTSSGSTNFESGAVSYAVGDVIYCSEINTTAHTSVWVKQAASGGGTVQDVQYNGTTVVVSGTGIANITDALVQQVKYTSQSLTDAQKTQGRANINAWSASEYDSTATSYADNTFFYVAED